MVSGRNSTLTVRLEGDADSLKRTLQGAGRELDDFENAGGRVSRGLGGAFSVLQIGVAASAAAIVGAGAVVRDFAGAAMEAERANVELEAVLRASGNAAGITAEAIRMNATELQKLTGTSDEALLHAQSLFLTFRNIGGESFREVTELAQDMSIVFGQDLSSSAMTLGKALNDPIAGVTALRRVGVQLSDAQEKQIEKFVELGDVAGAQRIVLDELAGQVGGVAVAMGETSGGEIARFNEALGEIKETAGAAFLEGMEPLTDAVLEWADSDEAIGFTNDLAEAFRGLAGAMVAIPGMIADVRGAIDSIRGAVPDWMQNGIDLPFGLKVGGSPFSNSTEGLTPERDRLRNERLADVFFEADQAAEGAARGLFVPPKAAAVAITTPSRARASGAGGGAAARLPTALSAASLGLIEQLTTGLPDFTGGMDAAGLEDFRAAEAEFKSIRANVNQDLNRLGLTMADLDARGLELTDEYKAQEERSGALKDALGRIDLTEDLRLGPFKDAMGLVADQVDRITEAEKKLNEERQKGILDYLNALGQRGVSFANPADFDRIARSGGLTPVGDFGTITITDSNGTRDIQLDGIS